MPDDIETSERRSHKNPAGDIEVTIEYDIEEDIEEELEDFVRLSHTCQFKDAFQLFEECLSPHQDWYPAAAEYGDSLLRQSQFNQLVDFCKDAKTRFSESKEAAIFQLMELIANCHLRENPEETVTHALKIWAAVSIKTPLTSTQDIEMHLLELFLHVTTLTQPHSIELVQVIKGSYSPEPSVWKAFQDWCIHLLRNEHFWEARCVLGHLLNVLPQEEFIGSLSDYCCMAEEAGPYRDEIQVALSSLVQQVIYKLVGEDTVNDISFVPWNDSITWALFGSTLVDSHEPPPSKATSLWFRRLLQAGVGARVELPSLGLEIMEPQQERLCQAAINGDIYVLRQELREGSSLYNDLGSVALHRIAEDGNVKALVGFSIKAFVNSKDTFWRTALHLASKSGQGYVVQHLLGDTADPQSADWFGYTPLHYAAQNGHAEVVVTLLNNGALVDAVDAHQATPLHLAAHNGHAKTARVLSEHLNRAAATRFNGVRNNPNLEMYHTLRHQHLPTAMSFADPRPYTPSPTLESAVVEMAMEKLDGAQVSYYTEGSRRSYPISTIESFRDTQTGRRYITISPPISSEIRFHFVLPSERVIAYRELPQAYGSTTKHRIKFTKSYSLRSQRISSERQPLDASSVLPHFLGSDLTVNNNVLKEVSRRQEYDFESRDDYQRFQEMLMGPEMKLQLQVPIRSIATKYYQFSQLQVESQLEYLHLWQFRERQTLMFFTNSLELKEYRMQALRPVMSKSKTVIRLEVRYPGKIGRESDSKFAKSSTYEQITPDEYTNEIDLAGVEFLSIEFRSAEDRSAFLHEARFEELAKEPIASALAAHTTSLTE